MCFLRWVRFNFLQILVIVCKYIIKIIVFMWKFSIKLPWFQQIFHRWSPFNDQGIRHDSFLQIGLHHFHLKLLVPLFLHNDISFSLYASHWPNISRLNRWPSTHSLVLICCPSSYTLQLVFPNDWSISALIGRTLALRASQHATYMYRRTIYFNLQGCI